MNSSIEDSEIQINNFNVTRCDRKDRKGDGVVLYVKSSFTTRTLLSYCNTVCEVLIVEVVKPHIFVVLVYRPPDASLSNFFDITNRIETTLLEKYSFFKKVPKYIKYFHIKYKYKYSY